MAENKANQLDNILKKAFSLPDPLVWSKSGPVFEGHTDPVQRVQSKSSKQDCRQPLQSPVSKSQDVLVGAGNVTKGQLFLIFL